jgi:hypothetical protein
MTVSSSASPMGALAEDFDNRLALRRLQFGARLFDVVPQVWAGAGVQAIQ